MTRLQLSYAGGDYLDRTRALRSGEVAPEGIDLNYLVVGFGDLFRRVSQHAEFDVAEMSMGTYMMLRDRGDERLVAIPVFPSRSFRHGAIYVSRDADVHRPEDLAGKRVGMLEYQMTAALWARGFLEHDYGVAPTDVRWRYGGLNQPVYVERLEHDTPPGVELEQIPEGKTLEGMLEQGELDALISPQRPLSFRAGTHGIRLLFPDYRAVEREYWIRTKLFPIMHTVVMRREIYERHRWAAVSLLVAFEESKQRGLDRLRYLGALGVSVPWIGADMDEIDDLFDGDPFPYGLGRNLHALETVTQYAHDQGLTGRKLDPRELFVEETWDDPVTYISR